MATLLYVDETDPVTRAFLPDAKPYDYTVTPEEFDEVDGAGPGHYYGVIVSSDAAARWRRGLELCDAAGIHPRSLQGLRTRCESMFGSGELPEPLAAAVRDWRETVAGDDQARAEYDSLFKGLTDVGADAYSGAYWQLDWRNELARLGQYDRGSVAARTPRDHLPEPSEVLPRGPLAVSLRCEAYRLPDGGVMEVRGGVSWTRWTADPSIIREREDRRRIRGYRYAANLMGALIELERAGALHMGAYSWFGGTACLPDGGFQRSYAGAQSSYGEEKRERLLAHLSQCQERHPEHAAALRHAAGLAVPGSIEHVYDDR